MGSIVAIITRGEGKSERVEVERGNSDKRLTASSEGYYKVFQQLYQEGYVLQSTMGATTGPATEFVTLLFVKPG